MKKYNPFLFPRPLKSQMLHDTAFSKENRIFPLPSAGFGFQVFFRDLRAGAFSDPSPYSYNRDDAQVHLGPNRH